MTRIPNKVLIFFPLFLTACAHGPNRLQRAMDSWVGKPATELMSSWGAPDTSLQLADGSQALTWKKVWWRSGYRHECRQSFTVDSYGTVRAWSYNDC